MEGVTINTKAVLNTLLISFLVMSVITGCNLVSASEEQELQAQEVDLTTQSLGDSPSQVDFPKIREIPKIEQIVELHKVASEHKLDIRRLDQDDSKLKSLSSPETYLLNFTWVDTYALSGHQESQPGAIFEYNLNESIGATLTLAMPVLLKIYRNDTLAMDSSNIITTEALVSEAYPAIFDFSVFFDFEFYLGLNVLGSRPHVQGDLNPSIPLFHREFTTPLNGRALPKSWEFPIPIPVSLLDFFSIRIQPALDVDFSANVRANDTNLFSSASTLKWTHDGSIQSFTIQALESLYEDGKSLIELFDFTMIYNLNLEFYLVLRLPIPLNYLISANIPLKILTFPLLSVPIPDPAQYIAFNETIVPHNKGASLYPVHYNFSDSQGDGDMIIEPGETIDLSVWTSNLGEGSALNINTTISSDNVTTSTIVDHIDVLLRNREEIKHQSGFSFTIPGAYAGYYVWINVSYEFQNVNGSYDTFWEWLIFRVVHAGDAYLELTEILTNDTDWISGEGIDLYFNVTNRGSENILNANVTFYYGVDTDVDHPVTIHSTVTNQTGLTIGQSKILGSLNLSSEPAHENAFVLMWVLVEYDSAGFSFTDLYYFILAITTPYPVLQLNSAVGSDPNFNGRFDAGEIIQLEFNVTNIGSGNMTEAIGFLESNNQDLNFTVNYVTFGFLDLSDSIVSSQATIHIPMTALNQTGYYLLTIYMVNAWGYVITQQLNISITIHEAPLPTFELLSYTIDDSLFGDGDGIAEPGEIVWLTVNTRINHTAFGVYGNLTTDSAVFIYNATSEYADQVTNQTVAGDGFVLEIPQNFEGGLTRFDITVYGTSWSGRVINKTGYLELNIPKGDITEPNLTLQTSVTTQATVNSEVSFTFSVVDPVVSGEPTSDLSAIAAIWIYEDGSQDITLISATGTDYQITVGMSQPGSIQVIPAAVDNAGNIGWLDIYTIQFVSGTSTPTSSSIPSTTPTPTPGFLIFVVGIVFILIGIKRKQK